MNILQEKVFEFNSKFKIPNAFEPLFRLKRIQDKIQFIYDELKELTESKNIETSAQELSDILYLCFGLANELGIDIEPIFMEVHKANMNKMLDIKARNSGKAKWIIKPIDWKAPDIKTILNNQKYPLRPSDKK